MINIEHVINKKKIFLFIVLFSLLLNLLNLKDYGYAWDDGIQRLTGFVNLKYIIKKFDNKIEDKFERLNNVKDLNEYRDRYYGPSFEILAAVIEVLTNNISNNKSEDNKTKIYYLRCVILILLMHFSYIFFFKTSYFVTKNYILSYLGLLILITYPRFFAEQHYNTKDLYNVALSIMIFYFGVKFINKNKIKNLLLLSFFCGLAFSTRLSTLIIPFSIILLINLKDGFNLKKIKISLILIILICFFSYLSFPYLWENPSNIIEVIDKLRNHNWSGNVFYLGDIYKAKNAPWHYLIVWFFITTPILYSFVFLISFFYCIKILIFDGILKKKIIQNINVYKFIYINLFIFIGAFIILTIFQETTYNGWRQSYFLFIFFLNSILYFINLIKFKYLKKIIYLSLILNISFNIFWIYKNHPYQNLYFNLSIKEPHKEFTLDWWGLTNYEQIKFIINTDKNKKINIWSATTTSLEATRKNLLSKDEMQRINIVKSESDADYIINNYTNNTQDKIFESKYKIIKQIKVSGHPVNTIFKTNN